MTLTVALQILARIHTRDDAAAGFVVMTGAISESEFDFDHDKYVKAWCKLRECIGLQTEPQTAEAIQDVEREG